MTEVNMLQGGHAIAEWVCTNGGRLTPIAFSSASVKSNGVNLAFFLEYTESTVSTSVNADDADILDNVDDDDDDIVDPPRFLFIPLIDIEKPIERPSSITSAPGGGVAGGGGGTSAGGGGGGGGGVGTDP
jgi:uncharacterized membrane protein YgcG